jgi:hypothetical protein
MTSHPAHRFVAFACSVLMTLAIFSTALSQAPEATGPWVAQAAPAGSERG